MAEMTDYIKIESYLKDVPDNFLMKEIQRPTGEYPPVLIVAEYNRRKRMRNAAQDQQAGEPKSLVEDIKQEAGLMSAPGAMQTLAARDINQMGPPPEEMRPMPQQMPQQMPVGMAEGGLVAFEGGGPIRAQEGLYTGYRPSAFERFIGFNLFGAPEGAPTGITGGSLAERAGVVSPAISRLFPNETDKMLRIVEQQQRDALAEQTRPYAGPTDPGYIPPVAAQATKPPAGAPAAAPGGAPGKDAGGLGAFKQPKLPSIKPFQDALTKLQGMKMPTEAEIAATRRRGESEFEQMMPDRTSQMLQDRILRKTEEIQKDKDMSFNDALIAAGAAILKAPGTPGSLSWMGEGLSAFGKTMAEGKKDLRKSQDLLDQANIDMANSQSLRDQGKIAAADRAENKAFERFAQGRALAQSDASLALQQINAELEMAKVPSEIAQKMGLADYYKALERTAGMAKAKQFDLKDALAARQSLITQAMTEGRNVKDPQVMADIERRIAAAYPGYSPMTTGPTIRGAGGQGATLPGT